MLKRRYRLKQLLLFTAVDVLGLLAGLFAAYYLRFHSGLIEVSKTYDVQDYVRLLPIAALIWVFWLEHAGCYGFRERAFNLQILKRVFNASVLAVMTIIVLHFFQRTLDFSRLMYPMIIVTATAGIGLLRFALDRLLAMQRRAGALPSSSVLILGVTRLGLNLACRINNHAYLGMRVAGFVSASPRAVGEQHEGFAVLGDFGHIREIIRDNQVDEVIIAQPDLSPDNLLEFMVECEKELVSVRVVPNLLEAMLIEMSLEQIDGIPLFGLKESPLQGWNIIIKRLFDIIISILVLLLLSPLLALIAAGVRLSSKGPVLYRQKRVGLDGHKFNMLKFRSMIVNAEEITGPVWAREDDNRATTFGRLLRRSNLDELPQFWNVLRGDMSLVGPRPERPHFVKEFRERVPRYMGRHRVKSGMTGWAQVNGLRGNTSVDERIKYDLYYIENWSIWLDLKILLMTLRARENAY
jgi:exopolysaccharide biosynthesis polyprenyl glycosylphosphotransferase